MNTLEGKVTVVTGASRGLGEAMVTGFAREGASVVLAARTAGDLDRVATRCRDAGAARVEVIPTDVTDEEQVAALVAATTGRLGRLGRLDVFVANAGIAVPGVTDQRMTTLETYDLEVVQRLLAVNTVGMWLCMKAALPVMPPGGSFIAIGSELGRMAGAGAGVYAVTKASVDLLAGSRPRNRRSGRFASTACPRAGWPTPTCSGRTRCPTPSRRTPRGPSRRSSSPRPSGSPRTTPPTSPANAWPERSSTGFPERNFAPACWTREVGPIDSG